jgi:hypothetical protein
MQKSNKKSLKIDHHIIFTPGTRGGDMFEAHLPVSGRVNDSHSLDRIGWSHRAGQFWGLAVHPLRDEVSGCALSGVLRDEVAGMRAE